MNLKIRVMALLKHNCGNCKYNENKYCMVPHKMFYPFEGLKAKPYERRCPDVVGTSKCKWCKK